MPTVPSSTCKEFRLCQTSSQSPKPSRTAFNPNRPLEKNLLIHAQVRHFKEAESQLPLDLQTGIDIERIRTEGQASAYIKRVTRGIHESGGRRKRVETAR